VLDSLEAAGFEIIEHCDTFTNWDPQYELPWYDSIDAKWSVSGFKHTKPGMWLTNKFVWMLETVRFAPTGTLDIHNLLVKVAGELVDAGKLGIFSPSYFYLCRKPLAS